MGVAEPDRDPQEVLVPARRPQPGDVQRGRVRDADQLGEVHRTGQRRTRRGGHGRQAQRGERAGQAHRAGRGHLVQCPGHRGRRLPAQVLHGHRAPVVADGDAHGDLPGFVHPAGQQVQRGDAHVGQRDRLVRVGRLVGRRPVRVVDEQQSLAEPQRLPSGQALAHLRRVPGPLPQLTGERRGQLARRGGDAPGVHRAVPLLRVQEVRQPLGPRPVVEPLLGGRQRERHVVRRVQHRHLHGDGPRDPQHLGALPDHAHVARPVQRHGQRRLGHGGEPLLEPGRLVEHERVRRGEDAAALLLHDQRPHRRLAGAQAHVEEVPVEPPPLPTAWPRRSPGRTAPQAAAPTLVPRPAARGSPGSAPRAAPPGTPGTARAARAACAGPAPAARTAGTRRRSRPPPAPPPRSRRTGCCAPPSSSPRS